MPGWSCGCATVYDKYFGGYISDWHKISLQVLTEEIEKRIKALGNIAQQ